MFSVKLVIEANKNQDYEALTNDAFSLAGPNQKPRWQRSLTMQFTMALSQVGEQAAQGSEGSGGTNGKCPSQFLGLDDHFLYCAKTF